jgi:hypothetical protein
LRRSDRLQTSSRKDVAFLLSKGASGECRLIVRQGASGVTSSTNQQEVTA